MKIVIAIVVIIVLLPVIVTLLPKPLTIERIETGFKSAGFSVSDVQQSSSPLFEADTEWDLTVNGAKTGIYFYSDEGVVAKQHEFQKKDAGSAMVEAWNLSESLGAAPKRDIPTFHGRRGKVMIVVTTPDAELGPRIIEAFKKL